MKKALTTTVVLTTLATGAWAVDRPAEGMDVLDHLEALPVFHAPGTKTIHFGNKPLWGKNDFTLCEFADVEYEIPARYTKGKKQLGIRLVYREPTGTDLVNSKSYLGANEYYYWAFAY